MFCREKENDAKKELETVYENASKKDGDLFATLKKSLEEKLKNDKSQTKWNTYKIVCDNYNFTSINLNAVSIAVAIIAIVLDKMTMSEFVAAGLLLYGVVVLYWTIVMHEKERKYKYMGYVLDVIKKEKEDSEPNK